MLLEVVQLARITGSPNLYYVMHIIIKILRPLLFICVAVSVLSKWEVFCVRMEIRNLIDRSSIVLSIFFSIYYILIYLNLIKSYDK